MQNKHIINWLRFTAFFLFMARGSQHIIYNGPYSTIFYSKSFLGGIIQFLAGKTNDNLADNSSIVQIFDGINLVMGIFFIIAAISVLLVNKKKSYFKTFVKIGGYLLILVSFGYYVDEKFAWGQFFEYSSQMVVPWLLLMAVKFKMKSRFVFITKLSISITFFCHGLYAIGYYDVPNSYLTGIINTFNIPFEDALFWVRIVAYIYYAIALSVFMPYINRYIHYLAFFWALVISIIQLNGDYEISQTGLIFSQYTFEFLVRMPHFMLPLILIKYRKEIII